MIGKNRIIWFSERNVGLGSRSKNTEKEPIIRFHVLCRTELIAKVQSSDSLKNDRFRGEVYAVSFGDHAAFDVRSIG